MKFLIACALGASIAMAGAQETITSAERKAYEAELREVGSRGAATFELIRQGQARLDEQKRERAALQARLDAANRNDGTGPNIRNQSGMEARDDLNDPARREQAIQRITRQIADLTLSIQTMEKDLAEAQKAMSGMLARQQELKKLLARRTAEKPAAGATEASQSPASEATQVPTAPEAPPKAPAPPPKKREIVELTWEQVEGGHILAGAAFLGRISTDKEDAKSIAHPEGEHGSKHGGLSIWNEEGEFGSKTGNRSPFNPFATEPPAVYDKDGKLAGHLSVGKNKSPRLHPDRLRERIENIKRE